MTSSGDNIIIAGHVDPDGDCIGSCFALAHALAFFGKKPVILHDNYPARYDYLAGAGHSVSEIRSDTELLTHVSGRDYLHSGDTNGLKCDVFVVVDCGDKKRLSARSLLMFESCPITINIDHHISNDNFAKHNLVDSAAPSTCEIIYRLIIGTSVPITTDIASALYTGIVCDTGSFRFSNTTPETLEIAAHLMRTGIKHQNIQQAVFHRTKGAVAAVGLCVRNMSFLEGYPITYSIMASEDLKKAGINTSDLSDLAAFLRNVEGIDLSITFSERPDGRVKVSLRSITADVNAIASRFGGGGHINAAGALIEGKMDEIVKNVLEQAKAAFA